MAERERRKERKQRLDLSRFSHNLTTRVLRGEDNTLQKDIPDHVATAFEIGSVEDRQDFWKHANIYAFGKQMDLWLGYGNEASGMSQWVESQQAKKDPDVTSLLGAVGLIEKDPEKTRQELQKDSVQKVIQAINHDLEADEQLTSDQLLKDEPAARSLIFYATYLNPEKLDGKSSKNFIDTLVGKALEDSQDNQEEALHKLQKISSLFSVMGLDAKDVFGALVAAQMHAKTHFDSVAAAPLDAVLNGDEQNVWDTLEKYTQRKALLGPVAQEEKSWAAAQQPEVVAPEVSQEEPLTPPTPEVEMPSAMDFAPEILEKGKTYNLTDVFARLHPVARSEGNPYWVEDVRLDFARRLFPAQLQALELRETFFVPENNKPGYVFSNEKVFPQAKVLENNPRFHNGEALTKGDSGLLALAAASAPTPEMQITLYQQLGETIVKVHQNNPKLLEEFLRAQSDISKQQFLEFDLAYSGKQVTDNLTEANSFALKEFQNKFGVPFDLQKLTDEQRTFLADVTKSFGEQRRKILQDISANPSRLVAIHELIPTANSEGMVALLPDEIDISNTLAVWPERMTKLQEALIHDPLMLSPEQIRQIEFLAHSVDSAKIVQWMQAVQEAPSAPEAPVSLPAEEGLTPPTPAENVATAASLAEQLAPAPTLSESPLQEAQPAQPEASLPTETLEQAAPLEPVMSQPEENVVLPFAFDYDSLHTPPDDTIPYFVADVEKLNQKKLTGEEVQKLLLLDSYGNWGLYPWNPNLLGKPTMLGGSMVFAQPFVGELFRNGGRAREAIGAFYSKAKRDMFINVVEPILYVFAADAARTPNDEERLFTKLGKQVIAIYRENPQFREWVQHQFGKFNEAVAFDSKWDRETLATIFGTPKEFNERMDKLELRLAHNAMTFDDMQKIQLLALPFDLAKLTKAMQG